MTTPKMFKCGVLPNQIEIDPGPAFSKAGGNGEIYRGKLHYEPSSDGSPSQYLDVVLKCMRWGTDDKDTRFKNIIKETYVWMDLDHPNLLQFLGLLHEDEIYLVAPFAPHGSLPEYIAAHPNADRRLLLWHVAAGLAYLHSREIIHGDVKGANILVFGGPIVKICDFGLSKIADGMQSANPRYSLHWTSPERLLGGPRSYESDTYAFGMTIYEILSGKTPFKALKSFLEFVQNICTLASRPPLHPESCCAGVSYSPLWFAARHCWQEKPDKRPSMHDVRDYIGPDRVDTVADVDMVDLTVSPMPPSSDPAARRRKRMDSAETIQAIESLRAATKQKIHPNSGGGESSTYDVPERPSITSHSLDSRIKSLPRAKLASHKAAKSSSVPCLPGTRTTVLQKIGDWVRSTDPDVPRVFWLNGMAGTGKSTIAKTLAESAERTKVLGASFFFDRQGHPDVRNAELFVPTIAFQLAQAIPSFRYHLSSALEKDEDFLSYTRHSQLQTLLVGPLQAIELSNPIIVVLDALDECEPRDAKELLQLLLQMTSQRQIPHALKIFISCRPDRELDIAFRTAQSHQQLLLHEVEEDVVQADIEMYITKGLTNPPPHPSLPPDWISAPDLKELTRRSGKLFIYATTLLKYIRDNALDSSPDRLQWLLATRSGRGDNALANLDKLYDQVLRTAIRLGDPEVTEAIAEQAADRVRCLLGALVILRTPLPLRALANLVAMPLDHIKTTLEHLQSVVVTPKSIDNDPQFLHQSFPDFIVDPNRCSDHLFLVEVQEHERHLADRCLTVMLTSLKRNVVGSPVEMEIGITLEVAYACGHWASHLAKSPPGNRELLVKLDRFANQFLLWWLEALGWIAKVGKAARSADDALKWAIKSNASDETIALLRDAHRLVLAHLPCISKDPHHIYTSALPFAPRNTSLWRLYSHEAALAVHVISGVEEDWPPCLGVLVGHGNGVTSVSFSPNGAQIASGSWDKTVRIWDATSGESVAILEGHSKGINSIAFSPDGSRIVSGSDDHSARIWDTTSEQSVAILEGHSDRVAAVGYSPDGARIVSGSHDHTVRIWDSIILEQPVTILQGHSNDVTTVTYSPDGARIASGSRDNTLRIWDAESRSCIAILEHSTYVKSAAFSHDGSLIAIGSLSDDLHIWDAASGQSVNVLKGHSSCAEVVAFSPNSTRIASGSEDCTVRIWDTTSGLPIAILEGHSDEIKAIAFSPDGSRIVSGSDDSTLRVWDAASGQSVTKLEGTFNITTTFALSSDGTRFALGSDDDVIIGDVASGKSIAVLEGYLENTLAFSPEGTWIVSGALGENGTATLWDVDSGEPVEVMEGHSGAICAVAFSPDGTQIVSGAEDRTVRSWDVDSGKSISVMEGHSGYVAAVAFSPDGTRIVSGCSGKIVRVWDAASGRSVAMLEGHSSNTTTVAFSPDGTHVLLLSGEGNLTVWNPISMVVTVGSPLLSDPEVLSIFGQFAIQEKVALFTLLSEWSRSLRIPSFTMCGPGISSGCVSLDNGIAAIACAGGRVFILSPPPVSDVAEST